MDAGLEERAFQDPNGCQVAVVPESDGEGFLCPAFNRMDSTCRLYERRPFDCQLYPLALLWDEAQQEVWLGWDQKCPFLADQIPEVIRVHADRVLALLRQPERVSGLASHPRLIGRYQPDVTMLMPLPDLTKALVRRWGSQPVRRLMLEDLPQLTAALDRSGLGGAESLAAYAAPYHYIWAGLLAYWWTEIDGAFCLFVQSPDGWFMPLPPLTDGSLQKPLAACFDLMRRWNGNPAVSRIENLSSGLGNELRSMGYRTTTKDPDYLYRAADLAALAGDRYKSQRALCNRVERLSSVTIDSYRPGDRRECRLLFGEWEEQKRTGRSEALGSLFLTDARSAHEVAWSHHSELHLVGSVLRVEGRVRAYTFGYWLGGRTYCVLLEVSDRTIPGLAQFLFRDTCRKALSAGADFINTMDDSGLSGLRLSKEAYHPLNRMHNLIGSEPVSA